MTDHDDTADRKPPPPVVWDFAGAEPKWLTCACGVQTSRVPCWECSRKGQRVDADRAAREAAAQSIPPRFRWARLNAPGFSLGGRVQDDHKTLARRILGAERVCFAGGAGAGKTTLACACLRERLDGGLFMSAIALGLARAQARLGDGEPELVERAIAAPLLLLDDVGQEPKVSTNAVKDVVFARYDADLPTWVTTGLTSQELVALYGDGFLRRIAGDGALVVKLAKVAGANPAP